MNIKKICACLLGVSSLFATATETYKYNDYYYQRKSLFEELPVYSHDIVFLGNSLTNNGRWYEMFNNPNIKNRGIVSDVVQGVSDRVELVTSGHPKKIFLLIGVNDVSHHLTADSIVTAVENLIIKIKKETPETELFLQSWLPINNDFNRYKNMKGKEQTMLEGNVLLEQVARRQGVKWINLFPLLADRQCKLFKHMTNDGLHLNDEGYKVWREEVAKYVLEPGQTLNAEIYPVNNSDFVMVGSHSLVGGAEWHELLNIPNIKWRTSWGDNCDNLHKNAKKIATDKPKKLILLSNYDFNKDTKLNVNPQFNADSIVKHMEKAILAVKEVSPETEIILQSPVPVNSTYEKYAEFKGSAKRLKAVNKKLQKLAKKHKIDWVDITTVLSDEKGNLKAEYTNDGFHLMGKGYVAWANALKPYLTK